MAATSANNMEANEELLVHAMTPDEWIGYCTVIATIPSAIGTPVPSQDEVSCPICYEPLEERRLYRFPCECKSNELHIACAKQYIVQEVTKAEERRFEHSPSGRNGTDMKTTCNPACVCCRASFKFVRLVSAPPPQPSHTLQDDNDKAGHIKEEEVRSVDERDSQPSAPPAMPIHDYSTLVSNEEQYVGRIGRGQISGEISDVEGILSAMYVQFTGTSSLPVTDESINSAMSRWAIEQSDGWSSDEEDVKHIAPTTSYLERLSDWAQHQSASPSWISTRDIVPRRTHLQRFGSWYPQNSPSMYRGNFCHVSSPSTVGHCSYNTKTTHRQVKQHPQETSPIRSIASHNARNVARHLNKQPTKPSKKTNTKRRSSSQ